MNKTFNKSLKSYKKFLKSYFLRGFTFADGLDENETKKVEDNRLDPEMRENLNGPNPNIGTGGDNSTENKDLKEEAILSPGQVALRNYFRNPLGVIGLIMFLAIILVVFIGSRVLPFNQYYSQGNLTNVAPGGAYMNFPGEMEKEGTKKISMGNTLLLALQTKTMFMFGDQTTKTILQPYLIK